jgi:hypothetical protein
MQPLMRGDLFSNLQRYLQMERISCAKPMYHDASTPRRCSSYLEPPNHIKQQIRLRPKHLLLLHLYNLTIIKHEPIIPLPSIINIMPAINLSLMNDDAAELVHQTIAGAVDVLVVR